VFVPSKLFQPNVMQHSSLFGVSISSEENEVLYIWSQIILTQFSLDLFTD
jgi:hypothetical protein